MTQISDLVPARLCLEDGTIFRGRSFSVPAGHTRTGEVVFNTSMTGYQEALTDPSYAGQILCMTATQIGNYGVCPEDEEAAAPTVAGFVVRESARLRSNQRAEADLGDWLAAAGVPAIEGIDTRALVRRLRERGSLRGVVSTDATLDDATLRAQARSLPAMTGQNLAESVSPKDRGVWDETLGDWRPLVMATPASPTRAYTVLAIDCGAKRNIYRHLRERGCVVETVPYDITPEAVRERHPDGLFVSNGPGDPAAVAVTIETLRVVAGEVPTFGICLGHQLLALALGATTYKLKFGHRGANQPVRNVLTGRVEITSQNHGFCVDADSLEAIDCEITHLHLNDGTVAGFRHRSRPIFSVQYHPEASPGPHDSSYLFDCFIEMMRSREPVDGPTMLRLHQHMHQMVGGDGGGVSVAGGMTPAASGR
ncbi:MAG: glutamine-hydrolyzing carbamoyl-phosphate synthase small subunit [Phycisphaerae bacterium]|nr:glutamine-hydrolyzing carbamoyl-phosphate synthase small subunit [Phycisphaerae bacterium]